MQPDKIQSDTLDALAGALAKAQSEISDASMSAYNPHFRKRYADLSDVWAVCRGPLSKNGLAVVQLPRTEDKIVTVRTVLMHSSGQWIAGEISAPTDKFTAQGIGGAVTYLRRFGLAAIVGIAPRGEDDDGEGTEPARSSYPEQRGPRADQPPPEPPRAEPVAGGVPPKAAEPPSLAERQLCERLIAQAKDRSVAAVSTCKAIEDSGLPPALRRRAFAALLARVIPEQSGLDGLCSWLDYFFAEVPKDTPEREQLRPIVQATADRLGWTMAKQNEWAAAQGQQAA